MTLMQKIVVAIAVPLAVCACASHGGKPAARPATQPVAEIPTIETSTAPMLASTSAAPATPAATLPSDHPDIAEMIRSRQAQKSAAQPLPAGHPDIAAMQGGAPAAGGMPKLPSGHPDISQMQRPTTQKAVIIGTLSVEAVQSTTGGPAIGAVPLTVELYQNEQLFDKMETKLDATGKLELKDIPVGVTVQPLVKVNYGGVEYQALGSVMDGLHPTQSVKVPVYETTEQAPAWQVQMAHLIVEPTTAGVKVTEMLAAQNPTDRSWIGVADASGKRITTVFPVPADATELQVGGAFHDCCTKIEQGRLVNSMALVPGMTQFSMSYVIPVKAGAAELELKTPAPVGQLMLFVPDDGSVVNATGLTGGGVTKMGSGKTRMFQGANLQPGQPVKLAISNITTAAPVAEATAAGSTPAMSSSVAKLVAGVGGLVIFVVGGFFLLIKSPKPAGKRAKA